MPNHVKNVLKFKNLKPDDVDFILNTIAIESEDVPINYWIDFDKIIPQPRFESECPDDCKVNKDSHISPDPDRPWFDWYRWRLKYWGTKWAAYDCYSKVGKSYVTFVFSTAWSVAQPVIEQLRLMGYDFELRYADEDWGHNCGWITYSRTDGFTHYPENELAHPERFARYTWDKY